MNRADIKKTINRLCLESGMSNIEFASRIYDAMKKSDSKLNPPEISTINRWYNGRTVPSEHWYPFIAIALGKMVSELTGDFESEYKKRIEELTLQLDAKEEEKTLIERIVWLDGEGLIFLAIMLLEYGSIFANATWFDSGALFLASIISLIVTGRIFDKKFPDLDECKTIGDKTKANIRFISRVIELAKQKSILFGIFSNYLFIICLVVFLPAIESLFYKGTFYVSTVIYFLAALAMIARGVYNR